MSGTGFRISFLLTAAWWLLLTIPSLRNVRQTHALEGRPESPREIFRGWA